MDTKDKLKKVHEQYKKLNTLGTGAYGTAYLVEGQTTKR